VTGNDVPVGDMPNIPQPQRQDASELTDADLAVLLAGKAGTAPVPRPVADILAALTAEATTGELAGEARALAEFRRRSAAPVPGRRASRRAARPGSRLGTKVAAAATGVAVVLAGAATAAFADVLPAPFQRFAHEVIGAPNAPAPRQPSPAHGQPAAPGSGAAHGRPGAHGAPPAKGKHRASQGQGQQGNGTGQQGNGQGQQGNGGGQGQGNPHGKGKHGKPHGSGPHGNGQGQGGNGQGQGGGPYATSQPVSPQLKEMRGNSHQRRPAGHPRRPARIRPATDP